jgi:heme A synthase
MNQNPYRAPTIKRGRVKSDDDIVPRSKETLLFPSLILLTAFFGSWVAPLLINQFELLFRRYDGELPGMTQVVLATRHGWVIFLIVAFALTVWIGKDKEQTRRALRAKNRAMIVFSIVFGIAIAVAYYALYVPILKMTKII